MPLVIQTQGLNSVVDLGAAAAFQAALNAREPEDIFNTLGTVIRAQQGTVRIPVLWYPPRVREWVGERMFGSIQGGEHLITVLTWESSVVVPRTVIEDQQGSEVERAVRELATRYIQHQARQYVEILSNGASLNTFDGRPLLTSNPATRGASNVNLLTAELSKSALEDAIARMGLFTDPDGEPLGMVPTHLLVGPKLEFLARELTQSQTLIVSGGATQNVLGASNALFGVAQVVVSPYITDNDWYLIAAGDNQHRPVIRVDRPDVPIEFAAHTSPDHDTVFRYDSYVYGIRARHGYGAGAWYAVVASQPS